ncbi:MAG: insulinase family protein [Flavobacteriales bacterium]|nr:insulinase family protein [Flavobacteriales bacterium]
MSFKTFVLENGIRVIHQELPYGDVAHCGLIINVGSRDELPEERGMAHFIEHTIFKGTRKRKAFHILSRLDAVGGEINAYTTKEETCIYASFLSHHYERAIELITDITFNSTLPKKEIDKEKDVIIDEINSYLDDPSETIFDDFEEQLFTGHQIGGNILGEEKLIKKFTVTDIQQFIQKNYSTDEMVFASVGPISFAKLKQQIEKHLGKIEQKSADKKRVEFTGYKPKRIERKRANFQEHVMLGSLAYASQSDKRRGLILLSNLLGGPGLNSRLNLNIREKYGFTYYLESNYTAYSDTGFFNIYFGTDKKHLDKTRSLVLKELRTLREKKLGVNQLHQAKQQLIGQIALSQENKASLMLTIGKSIMLYDVVDPIEKVFEKIERITAEEIQEIANEVFAEDQLTHLTYLSK